MRGGRESSAFASRILATSSGRLGGSGDVARGVGERAHGRGSRGGFRSRTRARTPRAFVRDRRERVGGSRAFACAPRARWLVVTSVFFATRREGVDPAAGGGRGSFLARGAPRAARRAALVWRRARGRSRAVPRGSLGRGGAQTRGARAVRRLRLLLGRERAERDARSRPRVVATHVVRPPLRPVVRADVRRRNRRRARHVARAKTGVPRADGCAPRREARGDPSSKRRTTRVQSVGTSEENCVFAQTRARRSDTPRLSPPASTAHGSARARGLGCPPLAAHVSVGPARVPSPARARRVAARTWCRLWRRLVVAPSLGRVASLFASSRSRAGAARTRSPGT